jgi:hypothetical protein
MFTQIRNQPPTSQKDNGVTQTLDIDSTYRNRIKFPLPSDFDIPMYYGASAGTAKEAKDPISKSFPVVTNTSFGSYAGPTSTITLNSNSMPYNAVYSNFYLENDCNSFAGTHGYYKILSYDPSTLTAVIPTPITPTNNYNIRRDLPILRDTLGVIAAVTTTEVVLGASASTTDKIYENCYLRIFSGVAAQSYAIIIGYTGATRTAILKTAISALAAPGDGYEILPYTKDNFSPLLYHGTSTMNQLVCYDVELMYVMLPNVLVKNGNRGSLDDYPYFYLRLYNINSKPSTTRMITNNPNSREAIFRVPMDITLKDDTFFTLKTKNPPQTISFKPDDSLHFSICLPNGEPIEFVSDDWLSPGEPNTQLQISATFSITRNV